MSDHPTVPQPEANLMVAAELAIAKLQADALAAANAALKAKEDAVAAKAAADRAEKSASKWKKLTVVLGLVVVLLLVTAGVTGYFVNQTRNNTNALRGQAITSCQIGNDRATGTVVSMDRLITVLEGPKPKAEIVTIAGNLEKYILQHNPQRNCQAAYSPNANAGG